MPHPIYGDPVHQLTSVEMKLYLPRRYKNGQFSLTAYGRSATCRESLWSIQETWTTAEVRSGLPPSEAAAHVLLTAIQDSPSSQRQMEACLVGEGWTQPQLDL